MTTSLPNLSRMDFRQIPLADIYILPLGRAKHRCDLRLRARNPPHPNPFKSQNTTYNYAVASASGALAWE